MPRSEKISYAKLPRFFGKICALGFGTSRRADIPHEGRVMAVKVATILGMWED